MSLSTEPSKSLVRFAQQFVFQKFELEHTTFAAARLFASKRLRLTVSKFLFRFKKKSLSTFAKWFPKPSKLRFGLQMLQLAAAMLVATVDLAVADLAVVTADLVAVATSKH